MAFCDFVVKHDFSSEPQEALTKKIIASVILGRIKNKKPVVAFVGGGSGEGKSFSILRLQEILLGLQGLDINDYLGIMNVHTPLEYPEKIGKLLYEKEFRRVNVIAMHEAREVVKAKNWQSFLTQSVADINSMSRSLKRMCIFIVSQFIRDVTTDIRYTLNFYMIVRRPKGKPARLYINVMWKDDRDLEKPKLKKRKLSGYIVDPNGRYRRFVPQYLELRKPEKGIIERFEKEDFESKALIIRNKLNKLMDQMRLEAGQVNEKIEAMVDHYVKNVDNLHLIGRVVRKEWRLRPEARSMHDLSKEEAVIFESKLNRALRDKGVIGGVSEGE